MLYVLIFLKQIAAESTLCENALPINYGKNIIRWNNIPNAGRFTDIYGAEVANNSVGGATLFLFNSSSNSPFTLFTCGNPAPGPKPLYNPFWIAYIYNECPFAQPIRPLIQSNSSVIDPQSLNYATNTYQSSKFFLGNLTKKYLCTIALANGNLAQYISLTSSATTLWILIANSQSLYPSNSMNVILDYAGPTATSTPSNGITASICASNSPSPIGSVSLFLSNFTSPSSSDSVSLSENRYITETSKPYVSATASACASVSARPSASSTSTSSGSFLRSAPVSACSSAFTCSTGTTTFKTASLYVSGTVSITHSESLTVSLIKSTSVTVSKFYSRSPIVHTFCASVSSKASPCASMSFSRTCLPSHLPTALGSPCGSATTTVCASSSAFPSTSSFSSGFESPTSSVSAAACGSASACNSSTTSPLKSMPSSASGTLSITHSKSVTVSPLVSACDGSYCENPSIFATFSTSGSLNASPCASTYITDPLVGSLSPFYSPTSSQWSSGSLGGPATLTVRASFSFCPSTSSFSSGSGSLRSMSAAVCGSVSASSSGTTTKSTSASATVTLSLNPSKHIISFSAIVSRRPSISATICNSRSIFGTISASPILPSRSIFSSISASPILSPSFLDSILTSTISRLAAVTIGSSPFSSPTFASTGANYTSLSLLIGFSGFPSIIVLNASEKSAAKKVIEAAISSASNTAGCNSCTAKVARIEVYHGTIVQQLRRFDSTISVEVQYVIFSTIQRTNFSFVNEPYFFELLAAIFKTLHGYETISAFQILSATDSSPPNKFGISVSTFELLGLGIGVGALTFLLIIFWLFKKKMEATTVVPIPVSVGGVVPDLVLRSPLSTPRLLENRGSCLGGHQ